MSYPFQTIYSYDSALTGTSKINYNFSIITASTVYTGHTGIFSTQFGNNVLTYNLNYFMPMFGNVPNGFQFSGTTAFVVPSNMTLYNPTLGLQSSLSAGTILQIQLWKNSAATTFMTTISNTGVTYSSNTSSTLSCVQGDTIGWCLSCLNTGGTVNAVSTYLSCEYTVN